MQANKLFPIIISASIIFIVAFALLFGNKINSSTNYKETTGKPTPEKIVSSEITYDCKIKLTTNQKELYLPTNFDPKNSKCYQFVLNEVSPSGKYAAFEDVSGGLDSAIKLYSLELNDTFQLDVLGTSNIGDMVYLPNDSLVVLNGYVGEMYIRIYDIEGLFKEYPNNIDKQYKYFYGSSFTKYPKVINLPSDGKYYHTLSFTDGKLKIYGTQGMNTPPLKEYSLSDLSKDIQPPSPSSPTPSLKEQGFTSKGMVWTSGLSDEEKSLFGIDANYQLVKTSFSNGWFGKINGMFLISNNIDFSKYLGKCIEIGGKTKDSWENLVINNYEINGKWTYYRSALIVNKIDKIDIENCVIDYNTIPQDIKFFKYKTVVGTLSYTKRRPAPDINLDLEIKLDEPFMDENNASGQPVLTTVMEIAGGTDELYIQILNNIGRKVEVGGYIQTGYAEGTYLNINRLRIL